MTTVRSSTTPFYRLDASIGWQQSATSTDILQDPVSDQLRLGNKSDFPIPANEPSGSFGGMTLPRGITIAQDGRVLLADPIGNRILYYDNLSCHLESSTESVPYPFRLLWQPPSEAQADETAVAHALFQNEQTHDVYQLLQPQDVLFSPNGEIVVADTGHNRVLIYSWPELRLRQNINFPDGAPIALAYDSKQRLYVADANKATVWRITRLGQIDANFYGGDELLISPSALAVDSTDNIWVLDQQPSRIVRIQQNGEAFEHAPSDGDIFSYHFLVPPLQLINGMLEYPQLEKPACEPLYLQHVRVDNKGQLPGTFLTLLALPQTIRLPRSGVFISEQLDNTQHSSQWHRIVLEGKIPFTSSILVQTHTGDRATDTTEISDLKWSEATLLSAKQDNDRMEVLIQSGKGRYLHLRIELLGDGFSSPLIRNIQVFGPRSSSLRYLPPPFHQDPDSVYFLDRFLSYFDTVHEEISFLMRDFTRYLDPQGVPEGDFLDWLGSWFDWHFLAQWPADLRREMITRSIEFYQLRGTLNGIKLLLQWHTGLTGGQPEIIEHFRLHSYASTQGPQPTDECDPQQLFIAEKPLTPSSTEMAHWFTVVLPVSVVSNDEASQLISNLIAAQKPAHTAFQICLYTPGIRIGKQSSIGIDTWLGHYPKEPLGNLRLGQSSPLMTTDSSGLKIGQQLLN